MTNRELIELNQALEQLKSVKGKNFAYAVYKNKSLIEDEMKIFEQMQKEPHPEFQDYENERIELLNKYARKDDNGNPITVDAGDGVNRKYDIADEDIPEFQNEFQQLREKYSEVVKHIEETKNEYEEFLDQESNISDQLVKVSIADLPEDVDFNFLKAIEPMLDDEK